MMPSLVSQAFGANQYLIEIFANIEKLCLLIAGIFLTKVEGVWQFNMSLVEPAVGSLNFALRR